MVLYTVTGKVGEEGYLDIAKSGDLTGKNIYVNMTNKCPCSCVFCLRQTKKQQENNTLWLKDGEPSIEEVLELFSKYDLNIINELVFCGFGEPLERLEDVCAVIDSLKNTYPNLKVRLNTIGLANLIYGRDVTPELEGRFDTVSISLNAPDENAASRLPRKRTTEKLVSTNPGLIFVTRTGVSTRSMRSPSERALTAALQAQYTLPPG